MARKLKGQQQTLSGSPVGNFTNYAPRPIQANRAPTTADTGYEIGQLWADTNGTTMYGLSAVAAGAATWNLLGPGASDVDTLTGDSGGAISPAGGNITLAGGTNITSAGAGSTITFNLDAAITLATSVTAPVYTAAGGTDLSILAPAGQDAIVTLGDSAGATSFIVEALDGTDVFTVDSTGTIAFTNFSNTGTFTTAGGTASVNASSNFNTVINSGTSTGTVTVGNAAAGAITVDSGAGISIDAATASNFTVTGATQDLTLASTGGSVKINATEDAAGAIALTANGGTSETITITASQGTGVGSVTLDSTAGGITLSAALASADAINLAASAGGVDIDGALQVNIASSQNAGDAVRINASAGGIDIDAAGAAGEDITVDNAAGSVAITAGEAAGDAIVINASGGGVDITAATNDLDLVATAASANLSGGEAAADAVRLNASNAAGGMDIDAGTAGIAIDSTGAISLDAAAASNFSVSGAGIDLNFASAAGRIIATSGEDAADTIYLHADAGTSETIRIHSDQGTGVASVHLESDVGGVTLTSGLASADAINLAAASGGVDVDGALQINIASSQSAADAVRLVASDAAGGVTLECGTGNVNVTGGNLVLSDVATQLEMNGGAATDFIGTGTLTNGQVTIANTNIAANDRIFIQRLDENSSTALGMFQYQISAATSFTVESKDPATPANDETGDQSTFVYFIVRQN